MLNLFPMQLVLMLINYIGGNDLLSNVYRAQKHKCWSTFICCTCVIRPKSCHYFSAPTLLKSLLSFDGQTAILIPLIHNSTVGYLPTSPCQRRRPFLLTYQKGFNRISRVSFVFFPESVFWNPNPRVLGWHSCFKDCAAMRGNA